MKNIVDYLALNESLGGNGYVVSYKNKDMDSGQLFSFLIETDDSIEEFAKKIFKNDLAEDYFTSMLRAGMSSGSPTTCYKEEFIKYLEQQGLEEGGVFCISTLKAYMKKVGSKKPKIIKKLNL